ncbi:hypothetical protein Hanom_Chr12g01107731 [Helianthus anomalus]
MLHAIAIETMWILWKNRNDEVFTGRHRAAQTIIEDIKVTTFLGMKIRSKHSTITKQEWWDFNLNM